MEIDAYNKAIEALLSGGRHGETAYESLFGYVLGEKSTTILTYLVDHKLYDLPFDLAEMVLTSRLGLQPYSIDYVVDIIKFYENFSIGTGEYVRFIRIYNTYLMLLQKS